MKRLLLLCLGVMLLVGVGIMVWAFADLPPIHMVWRYGFSYSPEPTGQTLAIEGIEFVEIGPGCFRMGSHDLCEKGDLLGRIGEAVGAPWGTRPYHDYPPCPEHWVEFEDGFWIAREEVDCAQYARFDPDLPAHTGPQFRGTAAGVTWEAARSYCSWLGLKIGVPVRLPSEAEWECAAQAGGGPWCRRVRADANLGPLKDSAALSGISPSRRKCLTSSPWGLLGQAERPYEWCEDEYQSGYADAPTDGSARTGTKSGSSVVRCMQFGIGIVKSSLGRRHGSTEFLIGPCARSGRSRGALDFDNGAGVRPSFSISSEGEREALQRVLKKTRQR